MSRGGSANNVRTHVFGGLAHEHKALSVGDNLGGIESLFKVIDKLQLVAAEGLLLRTRDHFASAFALLLEGRQTPGEDGLSNQSDWDGKQWQGGIDICFQLTWNTGFERSNGGPFSSTLLSSRVEDLINHEFAIIVLEPENVGGDIDQERVEYTLIPFSEDVRDLVVGEIETMSKNFIGFSNQLHVTVFNAWAILSMGIIMIGKSSITVMDHFDVVTGTSFTNPVTTRLIKRFGSSGLENGLNCGPGKCRTTGHEGRTIAGAFLSSRNPGTNKQETLLLELLRPADRVRVVRVTAIDDDITLVKKGDELLNKGVNGITGLNKENNFAWLLQLCNELIDRVSTLNLGTWKAGGVGQVMKRKRMRGK